MHSSLGTNVADRFSPKENLRQPLKLRDSAVIIIIEKKRKQKVEHREALQRSVAVQTSVARLRSGGLLLRVGLPRGGRLFWAPRTAFVGVLRSRVHRRCLVCRELAAASSAIACPLPQGLGTFHDAIELCWLVGLAGRE